MAKRVASSLGATSLCAQQDHGVHKVIFPSFIVLNIILFAWSNCSMGAAVYVRISSEILGHHVSQSFQTYTFSLVWIAAYAYYACVAHTVA